MEFKPFCIEYQQHSKNNALAAEIRITVHSDSHFEKIQTILNNYPEQRIVIHLIEPIGNYINEKKLESIYAAVDSSASKNYTFQLSIGSRDERLYAEEIFSGRPHYYDIPVTSWDMFYEFYSYDITDMIISGILCFELEKVRELANLKPMQLRAYPDICQADGALPCYLQFFIRPEDIESYNNYIDIFDFWNKEKEQTLFSVFAINQIWRDKLSFIITDFPEDVAVDSNKMFNFGKYRMNCGKRCLKTYNGIGRCTICEQNFCLAKEMKELNLGFKKLS